MFMFSKKVWHTESFIWKMESDIIKALEFWEPYLRFEILRASWLMLTIQTVNTDSSVRYNNNIVAHNKTPAINHYLTRDYDRNDRTLVSNSADPRLTLTDQISLGYTATTEIRDWGDVSVCIDIQCNNKINISQNNVPYTVSTRIILSRIILSRYNWVTDSPWIYFMWLFLPSKLYQCQVRELCQNKCSFYSSAFTQKLVIKTNY